MATFIGKRGSDTLSSPSWKWVSMEHERYLALHQSNQSVVLATGAGKPPPVRFLAGGLVWFCSRPGQKRNPHYLGGVVTRGRTALWFDFTVRTTLAHLWPQLSFWVLIVLWHDQFANCAALCALSPPAFRYVIQPIFLNRCVISPYRNHKLRVFDRDSTNIGRILYLTAGGERAHNTAQLMYWSCHDTIRTQILNWSQTC